MTNTNQYCPECGAEWQDINDMTSVPTCEHGYADHDMRGNPAWYPHTPIDHVPAIVIRHTALVDAVDAFIEEEAVVEWWVEWQPEDVAKLKTALAAAQEDE